VKCFEELIENHFIKKIIEEKSIGEAIHVKCSCGNGKRKLGIKEGEDVLCNEEYKMDDMKRHLKGLHLALFSVLEEKEEKGKDEEIKRIK
jgi:hypothetical protein